MAGRKRRMSRYLSQGLRRTKNIHTRRTKAAIITRGIVKLPLVKTNKRPKK